MSSVGTSKKLLEVAKFGLYVTVPIVLVYNFSSNSQNTQRFMGTRRYVVYPPETLRLLTPDELREMGLKPPRENNSQ